MTEKKTAVQAFRLDKYCDCGSLMRFTGNGYTNALGSHWHHKCANPKCAKMEEYSIKYPAITYEDITQTTAIAGGRLGLVLQKTYVTAKGMQVTITHGVSANHSPMVYYGSNGKKYSEDGSEIEDKNSSAVFDPDPIIQLIE